jgi:anti-sigma factor RsiW
MSDRPLLRPVPAPADLSSPEAASAYVDGQLDADAARQVEARLAIDAELCARVEAYRRQNAAIRALFNGALREPMPLHLLPRRRERQWTWRMAAAVAGLLIGAAGGAAVTWQIMRPEPPVLATVTEGFITRAAAAHAVNATDAIFAGELGSDDPRALAGWLAQGLGIPVQPPDLQSAGFTLAGGRLLPDEADAAAQFIYRRADGTQLTLYVRATRLGVVEPGFKWHTVDRLRVCFWFTDSASYAMVAEMSREEMKALAQIVVGQGAS